MYQIFEAHLCSALSLTEEELFLIRSAAVERSVKRREILVHEGEVCRHKTFVVKGLLRSYAVSEDGSESIMRFAAENTWILDPQSYNNVAPSRLNIEALEDSLVIQWSKENMDRLFEKIPGFRGYSEKLRINSLDFTQNRVLVNISYTAEQKYLDFQETYPEIFQRIPLHMVASYLGVSRETLSRIRQAQVRQAK